MSILNDLGKYVKNTDKEDESEYSLEDFINDGVASKNGFTEEDADPDELSKGISMEMEHTRSERVAKKIALDHICEIPDYYSRLSQMEQQVSDE